MLYDSYFYKIYKFYHKVFETRGQNDAQRKQFAKLDSGKMISNELDELSLILAKKRKEYDVETEYGQNTKNQTNYTDIFKNL